MTARAGELLVVNQQTHSVLYIDPVAKKLTRQVVLDVAPHELAISSDGKLAYVPIYSDANVGQPGTNGQTIAIVDVRAGKQIGTIDLGRPLRPHRALFGSDGLLYVTTELENSITAIEPHTRTVVGTIPTGEPQTHMFAISADGARAYSTSVNTGTISILDLKKRALLKVIPVSSRVQRVSISRDGHRVYTSDQTQPRVVVINANTASVERSIKTSMLPFAAEESPDGRMLLVIEGEHLDGKLEAIDPASGRVLHEVKLPGRPSSMLVHDGKLYLTLLYAGKVMAIDMRTWQAEEIVGGVEGVDGIAWVP